MIQMTNPYQNRSTKKSKPRSRPVPAEDPKTRSQTPTEKMAGYTREQRHPSGREWKRIVANCIAYYAGVCHLLSTV